MQQSKKVSATVYADIEAYAGIFINLYHQLSEFDTEVPVCTL